MSVGFDSANLARRALSSSAGRLLIGYLLFKTFSAWRAEALPVVELVKQNTTISESICTPQAIAEFLAAQAGNVDDDDVDLIYEHCRSEFLEANKISPVVKQAVDEWVGTDLSKAETNQIFLAYELTLVGAKPKQVTETFKHDCEEMVTHFQEFRNLLEPLISRMEIDMDLLLGDANEEVDDDERELLNYVQYAQFCKSLLRRVNEGGGHERGATRSAGQ